VLSFILIKFFYFYRYSLYDRYIFVLSISFFIITSAIRINSRAVFSRSAGISRSTNLFHLKPFSIAFNKRPAGAISDTGGDGESLKCFCKLANLSDRIYITSFRYFLCQRCGRRYIAISDKNFPSYFIPNKRIRYIYCANMNKKYFAVKFYYPALSRCRADIIFINRFLDFRFLRQLLR
jgi:hypothetical protein